MTYRERRLAKAERLRTWAEKRAAKGEASLAAAKATSDLIPFGQPILVGHHSEKRHRRDVGRIATGYDRGFENLRKAADFESRADGIERAAAHAIYRDDEDAIERLRERIAGLEAERDRIKAYNATCRKGTPDQTVLSESQRADLASSLKYQGYACKRGAFPSYHLSNLGGNIKRQRDRLAQLERAAAAAAASPGDVAPAAEPADVDGAAL